MQANQSLWQRLVPALLTLLLVASILVVSCGGEKKKTSPTPAIIATPTMAIPSPTLTPTMTETLTATPTSISSELKFIQPVCDIEGTSITTPAGATSFEGRNEIIRVYHQTTVVDGRDRVEYNIVFKDEDAPVGDKI